MEKGPAIGIDLGTTYSCVAVFHHGGVEITANERGNRTTPSYVAFTDTECLIGEAAKSQAALNPENTAFDAKRLIGRRFEDSSVQRGMKHWPFEIVNVFGKAKIRVDFEGERKTFFPEEISSIVLAKMRETAEAYLGQPVRDAVITVPVYFNDSQRRATRNAGVLAGLNVMQIVNEPTAAAIAYGLDRLGGILGVRNVLVYHLGGATFDVSILSIKQGVFELRATAGRAHFGGEDFDSVLVEHFVEEICRKHGKDISEDARALRRLRTACERAKRTLSSTLRASIELDSLFEGISFKSDISRSEFEALCFDPFRSTLRFVTKALKDAKMDQSDIHDVVLVGGSTRIPCIQKLVQAFFGGRELSKSIEPDEAVACGAAIQAAMLAADQSTAVKNSVVIDVTPLSLGIETAGGVMRTMIKRGSKVPCRQTKMVSTSKDYQTEVYFRVFQGERPLTKDNCELGGFRLRGFPPAPGIVARFEVTFDVDANGILTVSAEDKFSGKNTTITITEDKGRFWECEVERMVAEAEVYHEEDEDMRQKIAAKNALENLCSALKRNFGTESVRIRDKLSKSERYSVLKRVKETLEWLGAHQLADVEEYENKQNELEANCKSQIV